MHSLYITPSYTIGGEILDHAISVSASYNQNKDLNRFASGQSDVKTLAAGITYSLGVKPWEMDFTTSLSHQQSDGYNTRYTTDVLSLSTGRSFLKEKNLSTSATVSLCYNDVQDRQRMLSLGGYVSASYTLAKVHVFSLNAGANKYSDTNITSSDESRGTTEITVSLNYAYTFSLLHLKRKAKEKSSTPE